ncbi:hypothetical protein BKA15_004917 [Microlunatus parietis]|uniref:Uncharacterized protein n=1 Tax=Microlunatus parietis TaxID=682979 RepID=A0A7Y9LE89_9ACTN|nr:hypothetical protein [Microlunatus parietis]
MTMAQAVIMGGPGVSAGHGGAGHAARVHG